MKAIFEKLSYTSCGISFNGIALTRYIKSPFRTKEELYADTDKRILENPAAAREYVKDWVLSENKQYMHIYTSWAFVFTAISVLLFTIALMSYSNMLMAVVSMFLSLLFIALRFMFLTKVANIFNNIPSGLFKMEIYIQSMIEKNHK